MPLLVTFRGQPIKRRRRIPGGLLLTFVSPVAGHRCKKAIVTQEQWLRDGRVQFLAEAQMPDVRALAGQFDSRFQSTH